MIYLFLADGFEEVEALATLDVLRRAGLTVQTVGVTGEVVTGSHNVPVTADIRMDEVVLDDALEGVILPGGMPGTTNLEASEAVKAAVTFADGQGKLVAAICAAPSVLGHMGLLEGKQATCFPGWEKDLTGAVVSGASVAEDGNMITGKGAGASLLFGAAIAARFIGAEEARNILQTMQVPEV